MSNRDDHKTIYDSLLIVSDKVELIKPENGTWQISMDKSLVSENIVRISIEPN